MPLELQKSKVAIGALLASAVWLSSSFDVRAEVQVSGSKDAMVLEARDASLQEITAAINSTLKVQVKSAIAVDRAISGRYSGSLRHVLRRILVWQNFVLNSSGDQISILISAPGATAAPRPPANPSVAQARPVEHQDASTVADAEQTAVQGWTGFFSFKKP